MDLPIDRMSGLFSVAGGTRPQVTAWLRGYGDRDTLRDTQVLPQGFFGIGLEPRLARRTYAGATLRALALGNFTCQRAELEQRDTWGFIAPPADEVFAPSLDFATQAQFSPPGDL